MDLKKPIKCPRCGEINVPHAKFCHKCGLLAQIIESPELREKFKVILQFADMLENNPKAIQKLTVLFGEIAQRTKI